MQGTILVLKTTAPISPVFVVLSPVLVFKNFAPITPNFVVFCPVLEFRIFGSIAVITELTELDHRMAFITMFEISFIPVTMPISRLVIAFLLLAAVLYVVLFLL
jgi:hypothetical protein